MTFLEGKLNFLRDNIGDGFFSHNIRYLTDRQSHLIIDDFYEWAYIVYDKGVYGPDYEHEEVDYSKAVKWYEEHKLSN